MAPANPGSCSMSKIFKRSCDIIMVVRPNNLARRTSERCKLYHDSITLLSQAVWFGKVRNLLNLAHFLERFEASFDGVQGILAGFVLDDIPIGFALGFAEGEHGLPIDRVLANNGLRTGAVGLNVNGSHAARILLEHGDGIGAAVAAITGIELHDDL